MNNKKESERAELHRAIWNIANNLRGAVDGNGRQQIAPRSIVVVIRARAVASAIGRVRHSAEHVPRKARFSQSVQGKFPVSIAF